MDAANGVPGRPLNWLPLAFIRADSVVLHLKAFSVTHAVKSLLSLKNKPQQQQPFNKDLWVFQPSAKPLVPSDCQCESLCECGEDDYEDEELQCQLLPVCASDVCFRRQSRSPTQNWASVQNFSWARSLARREPAESATIKGNSQESEKTTSMWTASVSPKRKDDADKNAIKENSVKVRSSESAESETQKSHATPTSTSTAHEKEAAPASHATPTSSHDTTIAHEEIAGSQRAPLLSLSSPKWWPLGVQSAAAPAVESAAAKWNFRMGQNAGAGALAGGVVSLCLHPVDTLKTIVQAQTGGNRNLLPILSSIISERGLKGLYRGLGSNLASSAPISAIYTLTYEAVKAGLLRHIPADMSALAHCGAGACASVATSIVFTPSECVKQQMQVNGLYQNSWQTFTSLLKQGGLPMLYKGWGAVLCRNVPQSVIKFYTYEALKHWAVTRGDHPRDTPLPTLQALAIGGIAGSTAAFFTTPFDVVKTRLQTQIPGSVQQYNGVIHTFRIIATTEGVPGLYRGLVPRLVIYVTQGALFFASYEFIKHVLAVEVPRLRIKASQIEGYQQKSAPITAEST